MFGRYWTCWFNGPSEFDWKGLVDGWQPAGERVSAATETDPESPEGNPRIRGG